MIAVGRPGRVRDPAHGSAKAGRAGAKARPERGFTLVEALLALAIFGVIAVLAYRATSSLASGEAQLSAEAQRWRTLETLFTRIEADFRQAVPRPVRAGAQLEAAWIGTRSGSASAVTFTRAGSEFTPEPGPAGQRVGYRLRDGVLELAYWPALDHDATMRPVVYPLLTDIAAFELDYLARNGAWHDHWPLLGEDDLPRAVRLTLVAADGVRVERLFALR